MKHLLSLALVTLGLALPGSANALSGRFMGGGTLSNFTNACINSGWSGSPEFYGVRYQPRNVGNNADRDVLTFIGGSHAFSVQLDGAGFGSGWTPVRHGFLGGGIGFSTESDENTADVRITSIWPASLDDTTNQSVRIRGQIRHFGWVRWCRVDFDVVVQQR